MADMSLAAGAMPFNLDAEQSVLGSVLMDSECMEEAVAEITADCF